MTTAHQFTDADESDFARGYDAAHGEIMETISQGKEHGMECMDCPSCEVMRAMAGEMVKRVRENMSAPEAAILEEILLDGLEEIGKRFPFA